MTIATQTDAERPCCVIAGDIGGTKTNIGFFTPTSGRPEAHVLETFASRDAPNLETLIERMLELHPSSVLAACFGVAGPVIDGEAEVTNLPWVVSEERLKQHFGWDKVRLVNDLSATAMAIPILDASELKALNRSPTRLQANMALVAPGTGLGQALLIYHAGQYIPVPSEGGHASFAPTDDLEVDLWRRLRDRDDHVSVEWLLSGQGMVNLYNGLKSIGTHPESAHIHQAMAADDPARVITEAALNGADPLCQQTLRRFCRILGAVAGDLALTGVATGGVFLGGGIPPKILPFLEAPGFLETFAAKGRFSELMRKIGVRVVLNDKAALLGAAKIGIRLGEGI